MTFGYDAFGQVRSSQGIAADTTGGDFRFQGQWLESATGIYNFRARDYDAHTGTFLSRDPVDSTEQQPESLNSYQFGYSNPYLYSDPSGMITITELNASQVINNILQNTQRLALQQARQHVTDAARGVAGEVIKSALKTLLPFDPVTEILDNSKLSGNKFAAILKDSICELIPAPSGVKNRAWFEVDVEPNGNPQTNGFTCGETIPSPEEFTTTYGTYSLLDRNQNPRVDFIFKNRQPFTYDRKPPAYLIGDVKRSVSQIDVGKRQWNAIINYAQPSFRIRNGSRGHQYVPMALYMTLFNDNPARERQVVRQGLRQGVKAEIVSFFDK